MSEGWELAEHVAEILDIGAGTRVFEVDCGRGEFLLPLHQNGYIVGGTDADMDAIKEAIASMPDGLFQVASAASLDPGVPWHVVVCRSFGKSAMAAAKADLSRRSSEAAKVDYLRGLLARMFAKATHAIAVLDVPDGRRQWMLHALAEIGANAIQIEDASHHQNAGADTINVFARV